MPENCDKHSTTTTTKHEPRRSSSSRHGGSSPRRSPPAGSCSSPRRTSPAGSSPRRSKRATPRSSPRPSPEPSPKGSPHSPPLDPPSPPTNRLSPHPSPRAQRRSSPRSSPRSSVHSSHSRASSSHSSRSHRSHSGDSSHSGHRSRSGAGGGKKKKKKRKKNAPTSRNPGAVGNLQRTLTWTRTLSLKHNRRRRRNTSTGGNASSAADDGDEEENGGFSLTLLVGSVLLLGGIATTGVGYGIVESPFVVKILGPLVLTVGFFMVGLDRAIGYCPITVESPNNSRDLEKGGSTANSRASTASGRRSRQHTPQPVDDGRTFRQSVEPNQMLVLPTTPLFDYPIPDPKHDSDAALATVLELHENHHRHTSHDVQKSRTIEQKSGSNEERFEPGSTGSNRKRPPSLLDLKQCNTYVCHGLEDEDDQSDDEVGAGIPSPNYYIKV